MHNDARQWVIPFAATIFVMMVLQMSSLGFSPLVPEIQREFRMSFSQVGLFTGMYGLSALLLSVPGGMLAKRFGERKVLALGLLTVGFGLAVLSRAGSPAGAFAGRGLWLLGYRPAFVCVMTAIALTCPISLRSRSMGVVGAVSALGAVIGAPFGSALEKAYGWRQGILAFAALAFFGAAVFALLYKNRSGPESAAGEGESGPPGSFRTFRDPFIWALAALEGMVGVGYFSSNWFVPLAARSVFHLGAMESAYIISTGFVLGIFANIFFGYLMDRFNKWNVMGLMMLILIPASLCMTSGSLPLFRVATALVLAVGLSAAQQGYSLAAEFARGRETGHVMGAVALGTGIFGYFGPQALGLLRDWTGGFAAGWYLVAAVAMLSLTEIACLKYWIHRRSLRPGSVPSRTAQGGAVSRTPGSHR